MNGFAIRQTAFDMARAHGQWKAWSICDNAAHSPLLSTGGRRWHRLVANSIARHGTNKPDRLRRRRKKV